LQLSKIVLAILLSTPALADSECTYVDNTVIKTTGTIEQTRNYEYETAKYTDDKHICAVKIDAKIGGKWIKTHDFYVFGPEMSQNEACNKAKDKAKVKALEKYVPQQITSNVKQHCKDSVVLNKIPEKKSVVINKIPEKKYVRNPVANSLACTLLTLFYSGPERNSRCDPSVEESHSKLGMENLKPGVCREYKREELRSGRVWTIGGTECLQKDATWFAIF